jgi:hypothetical protein
MAGKETLDKSHWEYMVLSNKEVTEQLAIVHIF